MDTWILRACLPLVAIAALTSAPSATQYERISTPRVEARVEYRIEQRTARVADFELAFSQSQRQLLEKLNRADEPHLPRLEWLVIPTEWMDELRYSPFPAMYPAGAQEPKLLMVDLQWQAFAAYEQGRLVRWGPVSSGGQVSPTPNGLFRLNWRSPGRHSTVNPRWFMKWYFNFENMRGLSLHEHELPGYPASHGCIRLLARDAVWIYTWADGWQLGSDRRIVTEGTPVLVLGQYVFGEPPPWRSAKHLARGIEWTDERFQASSR
jgi:lipoprotein-anchoring transpeptidase ErfK/SrfK